MPEEDKILISIIIPMYNVEKYVASCLESVLAQINNQIEVIVIDDGSTDSSKTICEKIINKGKVSVKLLTQNNMGLSATRNRGIEIAQGKYIMFLDSDDQLDLNAVAILRENIKKFPEVDIFYYDAKTVDDINDGVQRAKYNRKEKIPSNVVINAREYFNEYYVDTLIVSACLCLIKKDLLDKERIRFDMGKLYEDNAFSLSMILKSKKVCYLPNDLYIRRFREESITTKKISNKNIQDICYAIKRFFEIKESVTDINSKVTYNAFISLVYKIYMWCNNMMLNAGLKLECIELIKKDIICKIVKWPKEYKNCSFYLLLNTLVDNEYSSFIDYSEVKSKIRDSYLELFEKIARYSDKRIALYGRGKHTQLLLDEFKSLMGNELEFKIYTDTYKRDGIEDGKKIVNIDSVEEYADLLIVSSYQYRLEMLNKIRELNLNIEILDLYEIEKMNMFDERLVF